MKVANIYKNKYKLITDNIFKKIRNLSFIILNIWAARKLGKIPICYFGEFTFSGLTYDLIQEFENVYSIIQDGQKISRWNKLLLRLKGESLCSIVSSNEGKIIGFQMHAFRKEEYQLGIIHLELSGLIQEYRGKRISSTLRRHVSSFFASKGLRGLSATTGINNTPALIAAKHIGYQITYKSKNNKGFVNLYLDFSKLDSFNK